MPNLATLKRVLKIITTKMITINISLNKELADIVEHEVKAKKYANRSEFFRDLIRKNYLEKQKIKKEKTQYYQMLNHSMKEWTSPEHDNLFKTE
ncbi:MAG: ribbon-helix-helix domain-containing protein [Candidatus Gracilibacteria bacterium]|jgi:metal-responsive CopG/Arc/MetJ family transcriptional regulator